MVPEASTKMAETRIKLDAPFYTEEELDALEREAPAQAARIARRQLLLRKELEAASKGDRDAPMPSEGEVREVLEQARGVLLRDGGDLELVGLDGRVVQVRLKGACVGCPRAPLDLKNVVEALLRRHFPQIEAVHNCY
jgi:toxin CptA